MNERIKNFYDQVGLDFENFQRVTVTKGDMEKFAELIVRECAQVAFEGDLKRAIGQWGSHSDILKHFEVEHDVVKTFRGEE
jgi:hypothetical protein